MPKIILASSSPRRQHLLALLGVEHTIKVSEFDEYAVKPQDFAHRDEYVQAIGVGKVLELTTHLTEDQLSESVIIGGDLTTFIEGRIFHKPKSFDEAREFFTAFTDTWHDEIASVAVWSQSTGLSVSSVTARVFTPKFTENELKIYLETAHPLDKSGGYSIGAVTRTLKLTGRENEVILKGDVTTVLGFPVQLVSELLAEHGITIPTNPLQVEKEIADEIMQRTPNQSGQNLALRRKMHI